MKWLDINFGNTALWQKVASHLGSAASHHTTVVPTSIPLETKYVQYKTDSGFLARTASPLNQDTADEPRLSLHKIATPLRPSIIL
jgi:hypothetical protein